MGSVSGGLALLALRHVAATWPYYNSTVGHNHIITFAYDFGGCMVAGMPEARPPARAPLPARCGLGRALCRSPSRGPAPRGGCRCGTG